MLPELKDSQDLQRALVGLLIESFQNVMKTQCSTEFKQEAIYAYDPKTWKEPVEVAASLSAISPKFTGSITVGYPKATFLKLASSVLGEDYKEISPDNMDFGAEMLNIVFGMCKTKYSAQKNVVMEPAIPIVTCGANIKFAIQSKNPTWVIPFSSPNGAVFILVTVNLAG